MVAETTFRGSEGFVSRLRCSGCGFVMPANELYPFRCPEARPGDDIDHVLSRVLEASPAPFPEGNHPQPFIRYRRLLHVWSLARQQRMDDGEYVELVHELDEKLSRVAGQGLAASPFLPQPTLAAHLGCGAAALLVKDETRNVSASHKVRHLFGTWLHLEIVERLNPASGVGARPPLAIASCGNAALAAALLARAADRRLRAYLPADAAPEVIARLEALGAELVICRRARGLTGDPAYLAMRAGLAGGEVPFCCQGPDNSLALDGGRTLAYEMISTLAAEGQRLDRIFLQVGGGATASAFIQAVAEAHALGVLPGPPPRFHAVQTVGTAPLARAYERVVARILERASVTGRVSGDREEVADLLCAAVEPEIVADELRKAARARSSFMWPWARRTPSIAGGLLDDEVYDWFSVVRGMVESGGYPVLADEERLREAHAAARAHTSANVSATGAAGLAGAIQLARAKPSAMKGERVAVVFTGAG